MYSLNSFKLKVKAQLYRQFNSKCIPKLYSFSLPGRASVYHCRLRLRLSALNYHRFTYNFIDNKSCPMCNSPCEDVKHYLFHWSAYAVPREALFRDLSIYLPNGTINQIHILENHLLYGSNNIDLECNKAVFDSLQTYLIATGRLC